MQSSSAAHLRLLTSSPYFCCPGCYVHTYCTIFTANALQRCLYFCQHACPLTACFCLGICLLRGSEDLEDMHAYVSMHIKLAHRSEIYSHTVQKSIYSYVCSCNTAVLPEAHLWASHKAAKCVRHACQPIQMPVVS